MIRVFKVFAAGMIGSFVGTFSSMAIVGGFAVFILAPLLNAYYAFIFFVIGSVYTFRLFQKNKIQFNMDADPVSTSTAINKFEEVAKRKRGDPKARMPDRFLKGGIEEQPSCYETDNG